MLWNDEFESYLDDLKVLGPGDMNCRGKDRCELDVVCTNSEDENLFTKRETGLVLRERRSRLFQHLVWNRGGLKGLRS